MNKKIELFYVGILLIFIACSLMNMNKIVPALSSAYEYKPLPDTPVNTDTATLTYNQFEKKITLSKPRDFSLDIDKIIHEDNYLDYNYILTLPGNYLNIFEFDEYIISDSLIDKISIVNEDGLTKIIIDEKKILCYLISEDEYNIYINALPPKDVYDKIIVIDPGHGGLDPGCEYYDMLEKNLTLDISKRLDILLSQNDDIKAYFTRLDDNFVKLSDRPYFANEIGHFFLSVHINANEYHPDIHGSEAFYVSLGESDEINPKCAELISSYVSLHMGSKNRGFKEERYIVLNEATIPATLCELGFISNYEEAQKFKTDQHRQNAAQGLYEAIVSIFDTVL